MNIIAETIKGINVVIGAETTGLSKALSDVNKRSRDIQGELKQVEKLLKLDPTNTELLAQKQKLLSDAIETTSEKLNGLKKAQKQVNDQFARGEISEGQYRAFQREIAKTESELSGFENKLKSSGKELKSFGDKAEDAGKRIKKVGEGMKSAGEKMSIGITAPLVGIAALATEGTEEFRKFMSRLETNAQTAGASIQDVESAMRDLNAITGETDSNAEALSNVLAAGFKGDQFKQVLDELTGAAIKFSDTLKIEGLADGLQETLATGAAIGPFAELLDRSGVSLDDFNKGLAEASKNGQEQQYVLEQLSNLGLADVNKQYRENNKALVENANAQWDLQSALAEIGKLITPIVTQITSKIAEMLKWFNSLDGDTKNLILTIAGIAAAAGPLLVVLGQVAGAISLLANPVGLVVAAIAACAGIVAVLYNKWDDIMKLSTPLKLLILGLLAPFTLITAAVKAVVYAFQNWDQIKETLNNLLNNVKEVFNNIGNFFTETIPKTINGVIDWFKKLPTNIKTLINELPGIIGTALGLALGKLVKWGVDGYNYMVTQVPKIIQSIGTFFSELPGKLLTHLNNAITNIKNWGTSIISWAGTEIPKVVSNIVSFFAELPKKMLDVGKQLITGLWDGIKGSATWLKDKINDFADGIIQGFKSAFDIHSPSRVMKNEVGKMIGLGMAEGIQSTVGNVKSAMNTLNGQVAVNPVSVGAGSSGGVGSQIANSFAGMFSGAIFHVRSDSDIEAIGRVIVNKTGLAVRGAGGAR
ncbi:hypothetical protein D3C76_180090 [compost metagenome]